MHISCPGRFAARKRVVASTMRRRVWQVAVQSGVCVSERDVRLVWHASLTSSIPIDASDNSIPAYALMHKHPRATLRVKLVSSTQHRSSKTCGRKPVKTSDTTGRSIILTTAICRAAWHRGHRELVAGRLRPVGAARRVVCGSGTWPAARATSPVFEQRHGLESDKTKANWLPATPELRRQGSPRRLPNARR
jgi:hypothetical protein